MTWLKECVGGVGIIFLGLPYGLNISPVTEGKRQVISWGECKRVFLHLTVIPLVGESPSFIFLTPVFIIVIVIPPHSHLLVSSKAYAFHGDSVGIRTLIVSLKSVAVSLIIEFNHDGYPMRRYLLIAFCHKYEIATRLFVLVGR